MEGALWPYWANGLVVKHLPGKCTHRSIENDHHVLVPVIAPFSV